MAVRIGPLEKGLLAKYGYSDVKHLTLVQRHAALLKAFRALGRLHLEHSLIAARVYSSRRAPKSSKIFKADEKYVSRLP